MQLYEKINTPVSDLRTGDEFRSDDEDGGVKLYWIARSDSYAVDGKPAVLVKLFPSGSEGEELVWTEDQEIQVWRPTTSVG